MIQINLLPWRERSRRNKKLLFLKRALTFFGIAFVIFCVFHFYHASIVRKQLALADYLQSEITKEQTLLKSFAAKKTEKIALEDKLKFILNIHTQNNKVIRFLNELIQLIPNDIFLEKVNRIGNKIVFAGTAPSDAQVTLFVQTLAKSPIFERPDLTAINVAKDPARRYFELSVIQKG